MAKQKRSLFTKIFLILNILAVFLLLLSYLATFISPLNYWVLGLLGLAYPVILFINILFILFWMILWKKYFIISLLGVLIGLYNINNTFQFRWKQPVTEKPTQALKIMSYNVRLFDLYNWSKNLETKDKIFRLMKKTSADIMCIQEFYTSHEKNFNNVDSIIKKQKTKYAHVEITTTLRNRDKWGIATFSAYPIVNKGKIDFNEMTNNLCIYTDIKIKKDTIRVYNVHMQSIRFAEEDYVFIKNISENKDQKEIQGSMKILKRFKIAFRKRARQVNLVAEHIKQSPHRVIICGDFNDPPSSFTYNYLRGNLKDAFVESGSGIGNTYNGIFPSFRIDYILYHKDFKSSSFRVLKKNLSDHFALSCVLDLKPKFTEN